MPRRTTLSLDLLHTFLTLLRCGGNASRAARELGINQPSMSKRLSFLQHAGPVLARPWLQREGKKWTLTDEGARVLPAVEEIVDRYERLQAFVEQPALPQVAFGCGQEAAVTFVRQAAVVFRQEHPTVALRLCTLRGEARIVGVANGSLDLATVSHDEQAIHEKARRTLHVRPLFRDPLVLTYAPAGQPWLAKAEKLPELRVRPRDLPGLPLILPEPDSGARAAFDEPLRARGLLRSLEVVMEVGGWRAILEYVQQGFGVGLVSRSAAEGARASAPLVIRPLDPKTFEPRQVRLIARRKVGNPEEPDLSEVARSFHDTLQAVTEPLRASP